MLIRDRFAFAALEALLKSDTDNEDLTDKGIESGSIPDEVAHAAYLFGDAMLARSEK